MILKPYLKRLLAVATLLAFFANGWALPASASQLTLPAPGQMVPLSESYNPSVLKGIKLDPHNPFRFHFYVSSPNPSQGDLLKEDANRLIKYFLASLTTPEKDLWVNLSPYEKNRIVAPEFGQTEMGRDLLAQDYFLKQITASLIYPEGDLGKKFWKEIYSKAKSQFHSTNIPVNTLNKVWIVPDKAVVYENNGTAFVLENHLKVLLEEDYLAKSRDRHDFSDVLRQIVIPALTKEVNEGKNFAQLRQVFYSLILATWYKKKIKDSILNHVLADRNKIKGLDVSSRDQQEIYNQYLAAFKKGVYSYIKEEPNDLGQMIPRKYFSGGVNATHFSDMAMTYTRKIPAEDFKRLNLTDIITDVGVKSTSKPNTKRLSESSQRIFLSPHSDQAIITRRQFIEKISQGIIAFSAGTGVVDNLPAAIENSISLASFGSSPSRIGRDTFKSYFLTLNDEIYEEANLWKYFLSKYNVNEFTPLRMSQRLLHLNNYLGSARALRRIKFAVKAFNPDFFVSKDFEDSRKQFLKGVELSLKTPDLDSESREDLIKMKKYLQTASLKELELDFKGAAQEIFDENDADIKKIISMHREWMNEYKRKNFEQSGTEQEDVIKIEKTEETTDTIEDPLNLYSDKIALAVEFLNQMGIKKGERIVNVGDNDPILGLAAFNKGIDYFSFRPDLDDFSTQEIFLDALSFHPNRGIELRAIKGFFEEQSESSKFILDHSTDKVFVLTGAFSDSSPETSATKTLKEALRVLKAGGQLVVGTYAGDEITYEMEKTRALDFVKAYADVYGVKLERTYAQPRMHYDGFCRIIEIFKVTDGAMNAERKAVSIRSIHHSAKIFDLMPSATLISIGMLRKKFKEAQINSAEVYLDILREKWQELAKSLHDLYEDQGRYFDPVYQSKTAQTLESITPDILASIKSLKNEYESHYVLKEGRNQQLENQIWLLEQYADRLQSRLSLYSGQPINDKFKLRSMLPLVSLYLKNAVIWDMPEVLAEKELKGSLSSFFSVIYNLCLNALQAGAKNIKVNFKEVDGHLIVNVIDNGPGLTQEQMIYDPNTHRKNVFNLNNSTKAKGTGLGTTEAWYSVQDMGGDIDVFSEAGKGTTFSIRLPLPKEHENEKYQYNPFFLLRDNSMLAEGESRRELLKSVLENKGFLKEGQIGDIELLKNFESPDFFRANGLNTMYVLYVENRHLYHRPQYIPVGSFIIHDAGFIQEEVWKRYVQQKEEMQKSQDQEKQRRKQEKLDIVREFLNNKGMLNAHGKIENVLFLRELAPASTVGNSGPISAAFRAFTRQMPAIDPTTKVLNLNLRALRILGFIEEETWKKYEQDLAMTSQQSSESAQNGGIDLNPSHMDFVTQHNAQDDFHFIWNGQDIDAAQVVGVNFIIEHMAPVANISEVLNLK